MGKFETLCGMLPADVNWGDPITPEIIEEIVLAEREACAKLADAHFIFGHSVAGPHFAAALADKIRKRSNALAQADAACGVSPGAMGSAAHYGGRNETD